MNKDNTTEGNLVKFIRFGLYLTALIPLIVFREFISPFHFWKVLIFRNLVEVLGLAYVILILKDRSYLPRPNKVWWSFFLFTLAFTLTTLTSVLRYPSFWGFLERMGGLWTFWHYFIFFVVLTSVFRKKEHWQKLLDLTVFAAVLSAFYGFGQKTNIEFFLGSGNRERIFGTIGNAALFAGYELISVFLSLILYFNPNNSQNRRTWYLFSFIVMSIAVLMTAVRGSLLGYLVGLIVFAFLWMEYKKSRIGRLVFTSMISLALLFAVFAALFSGTSFVKDSRYLRRITNLSLTAYTVKTRAWAWQAGFKGWVENPKTILLGWGPENFNIPFSRHFNPKFFAGLGSETLFDRAHNMFIEILVTMGALGLLAYLNIFISLFSVLRKLLREGSLYAIGLISLLVTYVIHNSFIFDTNPNFIVFFTVAGFIYYLSSDSKIHSQEIKTQPAIKTNPTLMGLATVISVVLLSILVYKTTILPAKANYTTTRAIVAGWGGDFESALERYKKAISYDVPGKYEYRHRFAQYLVGPGGPSTKEAKVREAYTPAAEGIDKNIEENPIDYLPYLYGSRLNIMLGKDDPKSPYNDKALAYSTKALELSPTFVRTFYEIAQAYLNKGDFKQAIDFFQKAANLNPDTGLSYWYLGMAKIQTGDMSGIEDTEKALKAENVYNPSESEYLRLINLYVKSNDFKRIAEIYERMIQINQTNPQYYASLAAAYANLGRINDAVEMARKAVKVDPSFEPDARKFLKSLGREL